MNNIEYEKLFDEYSRLIVDINNTDDEQLKDGMLQKIMQLKNNLNIYISDQLQNGNISDDIITIISKMEALGMLSTDAHSEKKIQEDDKIDNTDKGVRYDLSSDYIKSELTDENVCLVGSSISRKIELIYQHTGIIIESDDKSIVAKRDASFENFMKNFSRYVDKSYFVQLYGSNWREEVEMRYKTAYDNAISNHVKHIIESVDEKNRAREKELTEELEKAEIEKEQLSNEISNLKMEISDLNNEIGEIQKERKEELEKYRQAMLSMVKNNSEGKDRFYSDGTLKPDGDIEPGIYTTYRTDRVNETGMQQRVNDANLVHTPLNSEQLETRVQMSSLANVSDEEFKAYQERNGIIEEETPKIM